MDANERAVSEALDALEAYGTGSSRGTLTALDAAIAAAGKDPRAREELERRLVAVLDRAASPEAKAYVCRKLVLIGSANAVPALARLLGQPEFGLEAVATLQAMNEPASTKALRRALDTASGAVLLGVIQALGAHRDAASVPTLAALLRRSDPTVNAAAAALGHIGTPRAASALGKALSQTTGAVRWTVADAALECAERLRTTGEARRAAALEQAVASAELPAHIRQAARR